MEKFREYSFLLPRYHCERSQSGRGWGPYVSPVQHRMEYGPVRTV